MVKPEQRARTGSRTTRLIVNADDFGLSPGVNQAVGRLYECGRLTSTSILANTPWSEEAFAYAADHKDLRVGIHLNLNTGRPLLPPAEVPTLVNASDTFYSSSVFLVRLLAGRVDPEEIKAELSAQIEACLDRGINPAHVDTHMHLHAVPAMGQLVADLAGKYQIGIMRNPDPLALIVPPFGEAHPVQEAVQAPLTRVFESTARFFGNRPPAQFKSARRVMYLRWCVARGRDPLTGFTHCLDQLGGETAEVIAHPAVPDDVLPEVSRYVDGREEELAFLTGEAFSNLLAEGRITLAR